MGAIAMTVGAVVSICNPIGRSMGTVVSVHSPVRRSMGAVGRSRLRVIRRGTLGTGEDSGHEGEGDCKDY